MKSIKNIIKEALIGETNRTIEIEDNGFLLDLIDPQEDKRHVRKRMINFVILMVTLILSIVCIVCSFMFFINDILLFQNKPKMNYAGAIIPECSCNREYVLFMFNSAEMWAETGIQLHKGDHIRISASGCFNSDVKTVKKYAEENRRLKYKWVSTTSSDTEGVEDCIYNDLCGCERPLYDKRKAYFGSILYQINSEAGCDNDNRYGKIHQISAKDAKKFIRIKENGILYFAVNDIYLSDYIIKKNDSLNRNIAAGDPLLSTGIVPYDKLKRYNEQHGESIALFYVDEENMAHIFGNDMIAYFQNNRNAWFHDNLGEILMCIEIERSLNMWSWPSRWYRYTERLMDNAWDQKWYWATPLTAIYVLWSVIVLTYMVLIFALTVFIKLLIYIVGLLVTAIIFCLLFQRKWLRHQYMVWSHSLKRISTKHNEIKTDTTNPN